MCNIENSDFSCFIRWLLRATQTTFKIRETIIGIETNTYTDAEGNPKRVAHLKMSQYPDGKDEEGDTDYYRLGRSKKHDRIAYSIISGMPQIEDLLTKGLNESKKNKNKKLLFELVYGRNIF